MIKFIKRLFKKNELTKLQENINYKEMRILDLKSRISYLEDRIEKLIGKNNDLKMKNEKIMKHYYNVLEEKGKQQ